VANFFEGETDGRSGHSKETEASMKTLSTAIVGLAIALSAQVAQAYVVQVVTTVPVAAATSAGDASELENVVQSAIRDVLQHAIAFIPSVVRIEDARIIGKQLYLVLLIADADGEAAIEGLSTDHPSPLEADPDSPDEDQTDGMVVPEPARL
jgi:hypothetical protein